MAEMVKPGREGWRSDVRVQPRFKEDLNRSYSAKYVSSSLPRELRLEGAGNGYSGSKSSRFAGWNCLNDPEIQRKKRVANYRAYSIEAKMKGSFRKSFRWVKDRYRQVVNGSSD